MKVLKRLRAGRLHTPALAVLAFAVVAALWGIISIAYADGADTAPYTLDVGYLGDHYGPSPEDPLSSPPFDVTNDHTASRPQSKLWWHDGRWWATLWNANVHEYHIYRLDWGTQQWHDTGVQVDTRFEARTDVLMDSVSDTLYIVSHIKKDNPSRVNSPDNWARLYRYTYDDVLNTYVADPNTPYVGINEDKSNTVVIDRDSSGNLWATYVSREQGGEDNYQVYVNVSEDNGQTWGPRFTLNPDVPGSLVERDDISTIVPVDDTVALLWTNQLDGYLYYSEYDTALDFNNPAAWTTEAISIPEGIDDHLSVKVNSAGQLFAAVKTNGDNGGPLIGMVTRDTDGSTAFHEYSDADDQDTRAIISIDETDDRAYIFVTGKPGGSMICYKSADITPDLADMSFDEGNCGTSFIEDEEYDRFDSSTTSKHNFDETTGLVVLASEDHSGRVYGHNVLGDPPPVVTGLTPGRGATDVPLASVVTAQFSKNMDVATVTNPSNFTLESSGGPVAGTISYDGTTRTATFDPDGLLAPNTEYTAIVSTGMQDDSGNELFEEETWSFTTGEIEEVPEVYFSAANYDFSEDAGTATITVELSEASSVDVTVTYATGTGTATANADYTPSGGPVTIPAGQTSATFDVTILEDDIDEPNETVNLSLSNPVNATLGTPNTAVLNILDNDDPPTVQFDMADYTVDEDAGSATITVELSGPSGRSVAVDYATSNGTATAGSDYVATNGTLEFAAGETSKTFTVNIINDNFAEADETVILTLSEPDEVMLGTPNPATLTIVDDGDMEEEEILIHLPVFFNR